MKRERILCICADDFGLSEGINDATLELVDRQKISAIGCMVRRNAWHAGSLALRHLDVEQVDIGLHLDLDFPATSGGRDSSLASLIALAYLGLLQGNRLRDEIRFQLASFEDRMGRAPDFIDGHRHVHQLPGVRDLLVCETASRYRGALPWVRNTAPPGARQLPRTKADVIHALGGRALRKLAAQHGIPMNRALLGVYAFPAGDYAFEFGQWLDRCGSGDVLMCHPSRGGLPAAPHDESRRREYLLLRTLNLEALQATHGIVVAPLSHAFDRNAWQSSIS